MAAGDHPRRAVLLREIGHRPERVAGNFVSLREREEVERPLIAMHELRGLARADRDHLREMELEGRRLREHLADGAEHERVHDELAARLRARDEAARPLRAMAGEVVRAERRLLDVAS